MNLIQKAIALVRGKRFLSSSTLAIELGVDLDTAQEVLNILIAENNILPLCSVFIENNVKLVKSVEKFKGFIGNDSLNLENYDCDVYESEGRSKLLDDRLVKYFPSRLGNCSQKGKFLRDNQVKSPLRQIYNNEEFHRMYSTRKNTGAPKWTINSKKRSFDDILHQNTYTADEPDEKKSLIDIIFKRKAENTFMPEKKLKKSSATEHKQLSLAKFFCSK